MTITRWSPFNDLVALQREMNRAFNNSLPQIDREENESAVWSPMVDVDENDNEYQISMDLPGMDKKEVKINYQDNTLTVSGERKAVQHDEHNEHYVERRFGRFYRSFTLPSKADAEKISASYNNGVLTLTVPKVEEVKPKAIEIR